MKGFNKHDAKFKSCHLDQIDEIAETLKDNGFAIFLYVRWVSGFSRLNGNEQK